MKLRRVWFPILVLASLIGLAVAITIAGLSDSAHTRSAAGTPPAHSAITRAHSSQANELTSWPEFGLNPQRTDSTDDSTGITAANVAQLHLRQVHLPGIADNSAIFLSEVNVEGTVQNVVIASTIYGIVVAIDPATGRILWQFTPPGIGAWSGTYQFTTASPIADPSDQYVYTTSPNGLVHKLSLENGQEAAGWPAKITLLPSREKLTASLNYADGELLASTGGYIGDQPPYVGHVVAIDPQSGQILHVFNTLCANSDVIISPPSCPNTSDSAILSRGGPVVLPGATRLLVATGNAPWNGTTDFGDSVIELSLPALRLVQAYTPVDQNTLNTQDLDEGSGSPALLPGQLALQGGKDGMLRVINLADMDGRRHRLPEHTGGQLQILPTPGSAMLFSTPAVWHSMVFVGDQNGTSAYYVAHRRLRVAWSNANAGTSPVLAGGLLYVYNFNNGGVAVYKPRSGKLVTTLQSGAGHWNSPIVVDGYVIEPEGNANGHGTSGVLDIWSLS
jgi:outer membrane protein assembly factor BamB